MSNLNLKLAILKKERISIVASRLFSNDNKNDSAYNNETNIE